MSQTTAPSERDQHNGEEHDFVPVPHSLPPVAACQHCGLQVPLARAFPEPLKACQPPPSKPSLDELLAETSLVGVARERRRRFASSKRWPAALTSIECCGFLKLALDDLWDVARSHQYANGEVGLALLHDRLRDLMAACMHAHFALPPDPNRPVTRPLNPPIPQSLNPSSQEPT